MPVMYCSVSMWRSVRLWRGAQAKAAADARRLGPWAATVLGNSGRELVLSIDTRTRLTVVCPLTAERTFVAEWHAALRAALEDAGIDAPRIALETDRLAPLRFERLSDPTVREMLRLVEFLCETELGYTDDLRKVQRDLNEYPHDHPPHYVPNVAVRHALLATG